MPRCGCCRMNGRAASGCSCRGGKSHVCQRLMISLASASVSTPSGSTSSNNMCEYESCNEPGNVHPFGCACLCDEHGQNQCPEALHGPDTDDRCEFCFPEAAASSEEEASSGSGQQNDHFFRFVKDGATVYQGMVHCENDY